ncbi:ring-box protein [Musa troglodytarum]|uniref:Ring-box protein n=1 Tax=Musa troglodytarum TaxID=320322 RepID=A0A9E7JSE1_9LILI|nr:ring-box protein [Musa troglodytarum]
MASLDTDVIMVPAGEGSSAGPSSSKKPKRFEIKKWNAVALWAWGIECQANQASATSEECTVAWEDGQSVAQDSSSLPSGIALTKCSLIPSPDNSEWEFQKYGH